MKRTICGFCLIMMAMALTLSSCGNGDTERRLREAENKLDSLEKKQTQDKIKDLEAENEALKKQASNKNVIVQTVQKSDVQRLPNYSYVTGNSYSDGFVSVRASTTSKSAELDRLYNGEYAYFLGYAAGGKWYKVNYNGSIGYVYYKYASLTN